MLWRHTHCSVRNTTFFTSHESQHIWTHFSQFLWKLFWCDFRHYSSFNSSNIIIEFKKNIQYLIQPRVGYIIWNTGLHREVRRDWMVKDGINLMSSCFWRWTEWCLRREQWKKRWSGVPGAETVKPDTHDAGNHASCLGDGDIRTTSNICTCEWRLC